MMKDWTQEDWRRFDEALRSPEPWNVAEELLAPPPDPAPLRAFAAHLDAERNAARAQVAPLLVSLAAFAAADVEHDPRFRKAAVVDVLNEAARPLRNTQPQLALAAASGAVAIAARLVRTAAHPSRLLGRAELERGWALFFVGRYRDAEEALGNADAAFDDDPTATEWDRAHAALARANVFVETHRHDEATREAQVAAEGFAAFGDTRQSLIARMVEGGVRFLRHDYRGGAELLDALAVDAERIGDRLHFGRARQTAGNCYIELGDYEKARAYFAEALTVWNELGLEVERVRTHWSIGVLLRAQGHFDAAIERIDHARRSFEALGIINDAALSRLELAEALLLVERAEEVPDLLRDVVVSFTSEGLMRNASMALAYLREAAESGAIEPRVVRYVREYLEEPTSMFIPLS